MAMKFFRLALVAVAVLFSGHADARPLHGGSSVVANSNSKAVLNLGGFDLIPANFINVMKVSSLAVTNADITKLDDDGYPTSAPSTNVGVSFGTGNWDNVVYRIRNTGTRTLTIVANGQTTNCSVVSGSVTFTGCGGFSATFTLTGAGVARFTTTGLSFFFPTSGTYAAGTGDLEIYRESDEADLFSGKILTPEYRAVVQNAHPLICRPMGWTQIGNANFNGDVLWANRAQPSNLSWVLGNSRYPVGIRAGGGSMAITNTGGDVYTAAAAPNTLGTITANEMFMGVIGSANTTTAPTLNIGGRGPKQLLNDLGVAPTIGELQANTLYTFFYDVVLNAYIYNADQFGGGGNVISQVPIEEQVEAANELGCDLWVTIPTWADDATFTTNEVTAVLNNLSPSHNAYFEYSNEIWNVFGAKPTAWANARGVAMGFTISSNNAFNAYYGIRVKQIMASIVPTVWAGQMSRVFPVLAYQAATDVTVINRFEGTQLAPLGTGAGQGNSVYDAFTGSANWTAVGNQPVDAVKVFAVAPYTGGTNLCMGPDLNCTPTALNAPFYQALVNAEEGGNTAMVVSLIDNDIRNGLLAVQTVTASGTTFTTPAAHGFTAGTNVIITVSGGTTSSGVTANTLYNVTSAPTTTTFTIQPFVGNSPSGANVNAGTAGSGTMSVGISNVANMLRVDNTYNAFMEANAARYDARRPTGFGPIRNQAYEGNLEPQGLSAGQCTSLGITGTFPISGSCAASIANAVLAWRNDPAAAQTQLDYFRQFMGTFPGVPGFGVYSLANGGHSASPSQLVLLSGDVYALVSGALPNSPVFQPYNGYAEFNLNP
jgi:hypothetical protein